MSSQAVPALESRDNFSSQFGTMMSMAGLAIGLGNCWRFPYLCAQWGGGPFLFAYLLVVILLVIPFLIVEIGMGKGHGLSLIHIRRCRRYAVCISRWSPNQ